MGIPSKAPPKICILFFFYLFSFLVLVLIQRSNYLPFFRPGGGERGDQELVEVLKTSASCMRWVASSAVWRLGAGKATRVDEQNNLGA